MIAYTRHLMMTFASIGALVGIAACGGNTEQPIPPIAGPGNKDPRSCTIKTNNNALRGVVGVDTVKPAEMKCPYTVNATGGTVTLSYVMKRQPSTLSTGCGIPVYRQVRYSAAGASPVTDNQAWLCFGGVSYAEARHAVMWQGGIGGSNTRDSLILNWATSAPSSDGGDPDARILVTIPGLVSPGASGTVILPVIGDLPRPNRASTFAVVAESDTNSYSHQWSVDGTPIPGAANVRLQYVFPDDEVHTISDMLTRADQTSFAISSTFRGLFGNGSYIYGVTQLIAGLSESYGVTDPGGTSPYSYTWTLDGGTISNSETALVSIGSSGSYLLAVTVTDAAGRSMQRFQTLTVTDCATPSCNQTRVVRPARPNAMKP